MKITTTNLALRRLAYMVLSALCTAVLAWLSKDMKDMAWTPVVYLLFTTLRDVLDKSMPNK
jgi:hypothetical protein